MSLFTLPFSRILYDGHLWLALFLIFLFMILVDGTMRLTERMAEGSRVTMTFVRKLKEELVMFGAIAITLVILGEAYGDNETYGEKTYVLLKFVDVLVSLGACSLILVGCWCYVLLLHSRQHYHALEVRHVDAEAIHVRIKAEQAETARGGGRHGLCGRSLQRTRRQLQEELDFLVGAGNVTLQLHAPLDFPFGEYCHEVVGQVISDLIDINAVTWLGVAVPALVGVAATMPSGEPLSAEAAVGITAAFGGVLCLVACGITWAVQRARRQLRQLYGDDLSSAGLEAVLRHSASANAVTSAAEPSSSAAEPSSGSTAAPVVTAEGEPASPPPSPPPTPEDGASLNEPPVRRRHSAPSASVFAPGRKSPEPGGLGQAEWLRGSVKLSLQLSQKHLLQRASTQSTLNDHEASRVEVAELTEQDSLEAPSETSETSAQLRPRDCIALARYIVATRQVLQIVMLASTMLLSLYVMHYLYNIHEHGLSAGWHVALLVPNLATLLVLLPYAVHAFGVFEAYAVPNAEVLDHIISDGEVWRADACYLRSQLEHRLQQPGWRARLAAFELRYSSSYAGRVVLVLSDLLRGQRNVFYLKQHAYVQGLLAEAAVPISRERLSRLLSHLDERLADRLEEETRLRAGVRARSACCRQRSLRPSVSSSKSARGGASLSLLLELVESEVQLC